MTKIRQFLEGNRVVDLSQYIPGPLAGLMFVDMGGEVIKIEPPSGNPMQTPGPRDRNGGDGAVLFDPPYAALSGSLFAAMAILEVLTGRLRTGKGRHHAHWKCRFQSRC